MTFRLEKKLPYLLLLLILGVVAVFHLWAYYKSVSRWNPDIEFNADLVSLFVFYYLSWVCILGLQFSLLKKVFELFRLPGLVLMYFVGAVLVVSATTIIDGKLSQMFLNAEVKPILKILTGADPLGIFTKILTYSALFGVLAILIYAQLYHSARVSLLEAEKEAAKLNYIKEKNKLQTLQNQLAPHFLFNCLNLISVLARKGETERLNLALIRLAEMLRYVAAASKLTRIELKDELEFVENYVELQKMRFGDRYHLAREVDSSVSEIECPPFLVHTLVENAYQHSDHAQTNDIHLKIENVTKEKRLKLICENNYQGKCDSNGMGIGMKNLEARLAVTYRGNYLYSTTFEDGKCKVFIEIPHEL